MLRQRLLRWSVYCFFALPLLTHAQAPPAVFDLGHDRIPNFAQTPTLTSAQSGPWTAPTTWSPPRVPMPTDVVLIQHPISYDSQAGIAHAIGIAQGGVLTFSRAQPTRLAVGTLLVMPGGTLDLGTPASPLPAHITAELVFRDVPIDATDDGIGVYDPRQFGTGLLAIDGIVTMHGAAKAPTFVRLASEPLAGATTLPLAQAPVGWQVGDMLLLPDTRQMRKGDVYGKGARSRIARLAPQWETPTMQSINGATLTLAQPLQFAHTGARAIDGTLDFLPHVANLSRNIVLRSENPAGTRGHILLTRRTQTTIRHALFADLGRTTVDVVASATFNADGTLQAVGANQIGRYALHLHHLYGPQNSAPGQPQFVIEGNAIRNARKWGIALHDSHYGLVRQNVVYNADGAGIVTEDGSESFNVIEQNVVVRNEGSGFLIEGRGRVQEQHGHDGSGFWFRGPNNYVRDNVSANNRNAGFLYNALLASPALIPLAPGNDPQADGQGQLINVQEAPLLEFARNETYSPNLHALELWQNSEGHPHVSRRNIITDFRAWHFAGALFEGFYTDGFRVSGVKARGDVAALAEPSVGFTPDNFSKEPHSPIGFSGHLNTAWRISNADMQGLRVGIQGAIKDVLLEHAFLRNATNILVHLKPQVRDTSKRIDLTPAQMVLRHIRFAGLPGSPLVNIHAGLFSDAQGLGTTLAPTTIIVEDYNGQAGADFQVFFKEQHPSFVVPSAKGRTPQPRLSDALQEGLTNQENFDRYGLTLLSAFPACADETTHPEILGYTCPLVRDPAPPLVIEHPVPLLTSTTAQMTWTTDEPATGRLTGYRIANKQQIDVQTMEDPTLRQTHTLTLAGLAPGLLHRYTFGGRDAAGNTVTMPELSFTTPADASPLPVPDPPPPPPPPAPPSSLALTNLRIGRNGPDVYVQWMTPVPAVATVAYGLTPALGTIVTRPASTNPRVTLSGLPDNTLYYAVMTVTDATGASVSTGVLRLGTRRRQNLPPASPLPDTTPPVLYNPIVLSVDPTAATIMFEIDELARPVLEYGTTPAMDLRHLPTTEDQLIGHAHVEIRSGLTPNTTYYFRGTATDASGNRTVTPILQLRTPPLDTPVPPTEPPTSDTTGPAISDLHEHSVTPISVTLTWLTDEPASTTVLYGPTQAFGTQLTQTAFSTRHDVHLCGLEPGVSYAYQVIAEDSSGNVTRTPVLMLTTPHHE